MKKRLVAVMLIAGMMTGLVGGCGAKGADQTEGTETAAEGCDRRSGKDASFPIRSEKHSRKTLTGQMSHSS